jgi:serine/alanine adding enzyme
VTRDPEPGLDGGGLTVVEAVDADRWDAYVAAQADASFCHLAGWRPIMEDVLGHRYRFAAVVGGEGELRGALPLVEVRSRLLGRNLLSMPFLNYGGPIGATGARAQLVEHALATARATGAKLLELRSRGSPPQGLPVAARKVTVTLRLPASVEELWQTTFRAKLRSQIRRPLKEGIQVRFGTDQVSPFYDVFARHMRDLGTPVLPRAFFEAIAARLAPYVVFGCAWHHDTPVAAGCGFAWQDEFEITWASALREYNRSAPNMLLYSAFMEEMIGRGIRVFNFGRCTPGGGTHRFKQQWGGIDEPLPWARWSRARTAPAPSTESAAFQLGARMWQRLPLRIANRIGPALARQLP